MGLVSPAHRWVLMLSSACCVDCPGSARSNRLNTNGPLIKPPELRSYLFTPLTTVVRACRSSCSTTSCTQRLQW
ncbi:hypothetical protein PR002_g31579, partial [Phytophthora rubi]